VAADPRSLSPFDPLGVVLAGRVSLAAAAKRDDQPESGPGEELAGFLWFTVGGENYALDIRRVREVIRPRRVTPVPGAPTVVMGILSHRGAIVAILDLWLRLGVPGSSAAASRRIIVVRKGDGCCGLLVDGVGRVVKLPLSALEPVSVECPALDQEMFSGMIRYKGALLKLLDLDKMLDIRGCST
jgi:purine-binding chemotaxis protein CheW